MSDPMTEVSRLLARRVAELEAHLDQETQRALTRIASLECQVAERDAQVAELQLQLADAQDLAREAQAAAERNGKLVDIANKTAAALAAGGQRWKVGDRVAMGVGGYLGTVTEIRRPTVSVQRDGDWHRLPWFSDDLVPAPPDSSIEVVDGGPSPFEVAGVEPAEKQAAVAPPDEDDKR